MMMHDHQRPLSGQHTGFTLLELLVVLLIIALAASFSGPQLWKSYTKSSERAVLQVFAEGLQQLRSDAFHTGRFMELPATLEGGQNTSNHFPSLPNGWLLERSSVLRMLASGVTNGASFYFRSPSNRRWLLQLQPFDGHVEIHPL